jgi:hypothetical protein
MVKITPERAAQLAIATSAYAAEDAAGLISILADAEEGSYVATSAGAVTWDGESYQLESYCPKCGGELDARGPFDGTVSSTGVSHGHEGFGDTYLCAGGHWWAVIQGRLIPPEHILTVVE